MVFKNYANGVVCGGFLKQVGATLGPELHLEMQSHGSGVEGAYRKHLFQLPLTRRQMFTLI